MENKTEQEKEQDAQLLELWKSELTIDDYWRLQFKNHENGMPMFGAPLKTKCPNCHVEFHYGHNLSGNPETPTHKESGEKWGSEDGK